MMQNFPLNYYVVVISDYNLLIVFQDSNILKYKTKLCHFEGKNDDDIL